MYSQCLDNLRCKFQLCLLVGKRTSDRPAMLFVGFQSLFHVFMIRYLPPPPMLPLISPRIRRRSRCKLLPSVSDYNKYNFAFVSYLMLLQGTKPGILGGIVKGFKGGKVDHSVDITLNPKSDFSHLEGAFSKQPFSDSYRTAVDSEEVVELNIGLWTLIYVITRAYLYHSLFSPILKTVLVQMIQRQMNLLYPQQLLHHKM